MKHKSLIYILILSMCLVGMFGSGVSHAIAQDPAPTIVSDLPDYPPGATVTLTSANWQVNEVIHIYVNDDAGQTWKLDSGVDGAPPDPVADASGAFTYQFQLPNWFVANYSVKATGSLGAVATTTFTDLNIGTYDQCSNDLGTGYTSGDTGCRWINGNLQRNNSVYFEGDATVQRLWLTDLTAGNHTITLQYGTTKGGKHAYDFLTTWNWSENWIAPDDLCQDITGGCTTWPVSTLDFPQDPNVPDSFEPTAPGARVFTMRNGTLVSATTPAIVSGSYAGDSDTQIVITFNVNPATAQSCTTSGSVTTCSVALWFGAHVAAQANWGLGMGAGSISGSPYHVRLAALDGASIGSRDNQMQANVVTFYPNGTIIIVKDAVPNDPQDFSFNLSSSTISQSFSLDDDSDPTLPNTTFPNYSVPPGTYTAKELMPLPTGWTLTGLTCSVSGSAGSTFTTDAATGTASITLKSVANSAAGDTVTCTYTDSFQKQTATVTTDIHDASEAVVTSVPLGSTVHDKAIVSGASGFATPSGTVDFTFYTAASDCTGASVASGNVTLDASGVAHPSTSQGPLAAGAYAFIAHYNGDSVYSPADSACEPLTVNKAQLGISTVVHDASHSDITNQSVPLGTIAHDNVTVSGAVSGFPIPAVSFTFDGASIANAATPETGFTATSIDTTALGAGSHKFNATVASDNNYIGATSADEPFTISKQATTTTTEIHLADESVVSGPVPLGSTVHDKATVVDSGKGTPTGDVTFYWYTNNTCDGTGSAIGTLALDAGGVAHPSASQGPLHAGYYAFKAHYNGDANYAESDSACEPLEVSKGTVTLATTIYNAADDSVIALNSHVALGTSAYDKVTVTGETAFFNIADVTYQFDGSAAGSGAKSTTQGPLGAGSHTFQAFFAGSGDYNAAQSDPEPFVIDKQPTRTSTEIHLADESLVSGAVPLGSTVHDKATVVDSGKGTPTGNVTFYWYTDNSCDGTAADIGAVALDSSGVAHPSASQGPLHAGYYAFKAHYSGDSNYAESDSACEPLEVSKGTVNLATTIYNAADDTVIPLNSHVALGTSAYDKATVTGETVFFSIDDVTYQFDGAAAGSGEKSTTQGPLHAGSHAFQAFFAGNNDYNAAHSDPEPFVVDKGTVVLATTIYNAADNTVIPLNSHVALGASAYDKVTVTGETVFFNIADVTYKFDGAPAGSGAKSDTTVALHAGDHAFQAFFAGNDDYSAAQSDPEPFVVDKGTVALATTIYNAADDKVIPLNSHVALGTSAYDKVTVTGETVFFSIADVTYQFDGAAAGSGAKSNTTVALHASNHTFQAFFAGNDDYNAAQSDPEPFVIDKGTVNLVTTIYNAADDTVIPLNSHVALGASAYDKVTITGETVFFNIADVTYQFDGAAAGAGAKSDTMGPLGAGSHAFQAIFAGSSDYNAAQSELEPFVIDRQATTTTTQIHLADESVVSDPVPLGSMVHDQATVVDSGKGTPTGNVTFYWFTNNTCEGTGTAIGKVDLVNGVAHPSASQGPLHAGSYAFKAHYDGDANYAESDSDCETLEVSKGTVTLATTIYNAADDSVIDLNSHVALGASAYDKVTVTGETVFFKIADVTYKFNGAAAGSGEKSNTQGPLGAGNYAFQAFFAGNDDYNTAQSELEPFVVDKALLTIATVVHDASHNDITNKSLPLGSVAHDNAIVTGAITGFPIPSVSFTFDGNPIANAATPEAGFDATSINTAALGAGGHVFSAAVAGNDNYIGATSGPEPFTINQGASTLGTTLHKADHSVVQVNGSVPLGTVMHDLATVTASGSFAATGSISFTFYTNGACEGDGAPAGTAALDANGVAHPSGSTAALTAGSYAFKASWPGDSNYTGSTSGCETFTVDKAQLAITTAVHDASHNDITNKSLPLGSIAHDNATVTGAVAGFPIPAVSFTLNSNAIDGAANAETGFTATSVGTAALGAGNYTFNAAVASDANYIGATSDPEPFVVDKGTVTLVTTIYNAADNTIIPLNSHVALGTSVYDKATFTGANPNFVPTIANVSYTFTNGGVNAAGSGTKSDTRGPLGAGSYKFNASFSGDANYNAAVSADEPFVVDKAPTTITTQVHDASHNDITNKVVYTGSIVHDSATVSGQVGSVAITGQVKYSFYTNATCTGTPAKTETVSIGTESTSQTISSIGYYCYKAEYLGDANYASSIGAVEPFTVLSHSMLTDTSLCTLPNDAFKLVYTPDQTSGNGWKLNASNPGQFYYNMFYTGSGNQDITVTLPYPWVTQGAVPIHVYSSVTFTTGNTTCLTPGTELANSSTQVTLANYTPNTPPDGFGKTTTITIHVPALSGNFAYVNIHLDYGLKGTAGYAKGGASTNDAVKFTDQTKTLIKDKLAYAFSDTTNGTVTITSNNVFKKDPGIGGLVLNGSGDPVVNANVQIFLGTNKTATATVYTDADGWYMWQYKWTGKAQTFVVKMTPPAPYTKTTQSQTVSLKANGYLVVSFTVMK